MILTETTVRQIKVAGSREGQAMNTKHLRRCAALLRDGLDCRDVVAGQLDEAATEIDRLQADHRLIARTERGEVWFWHGDGHDFPESLACPVVIDESDLRTLLYRAGVISTPPSITDKAVECLRAAASDGKAEVTLSAECANLLLAEIDGGREAFGTVVEGRRTLEARVKELESCHQSALNTIRKIRRGEL